jgi:hypothetical protein
MASRVEKRIALALPVLRIERLARVMSTFSDNSVSDMRRLAMTSSRVTMMGMALDRSFQVVAHGGTGGEDAAEHEDHQHRDPAADRELHVGGGGAHAGEELVQ